MIVHSFNSYIIKNTNNDATTDVTVSFSASVCAFIGCKTPTSPALKLPVSSRPADALFWSNLTTWSTIALHDGYVYTTDGTVRLPIDNDRVKIPDGLYVVVDIALPFLKDLEIQGILELDNNRDHHLQTEVIFINGGQLIVGWENNPILTNVTIELTGTKSDAYDYRFNGYANLKTIGVYGGN